MNTRKRRWRWQKKWQMKEFKFRISADSTDAKQAVASVIDGLNKIGAGAGLEGFASRAATFLANPLTAVAAALGTIVTLLKQTMDNARNIVGIAVRANISPRQAGAIEMGARATGIEGGEVAQMMVRLRRAQGRAIAEPQGELSRALQTLGFTMDEITKSDSFHLFMQFLDRLKSGRLSAEQAAAGMRVFRYNMGDIQIAAQRGLGENIQKALKSPLAATDEQLAQGERASRRLKENLALMTDVMVKLGYVIQSFLSSKAGQFLMGVVGGVSISGQGSIVKMLYGPDEKEAPVKSSATIEMEIRDETAAEEARSLERRHEIETLKSREHMLEESNKGFQKITPDKFSRMGLFITGGSEKLANEMVALNRQSVSELKAIKEKLKELNQGVGEGAMDMY